MRTFAALFWRDLVLNIRSSGGAALSAAFFALIIVLTPLGLGPESATLKAIAPGLFWIAALLATLLGLERMVQQDAEDGTLDLYRLSPLPMELVVVAKVAAHWLTSGLIIAALAPALALMLSLSTGALPTLALSLLLGTPGLSAVGAIGAALGTSVQRGGMVLAILVLPLNVPFLIFGSSAVAAAQNGGDPAQALTFLAAASLVALVVGPLAAAAALRLNED
jgi:heme exporter protein B